MIGRIYRIYFLDIGHRWGSLEINFKKNEGTANS